ncbi:hypothetical protein AB0I35_23590 [Nocardia sp. NPDC050378]|uniref:hypothetical protein n=1 Tax=Nocardia sp. NPDC050378 TaxID=3155400 RepID=UPI0033C221EE
MVTSTSASEVVDHFAPNGTKTNKLLDWWKHRRGLGHVAQTVLAHVSRTPYTVVAEDIATLTTNHPLGEIRPSRAYQVDAIKNWNPGYAFTHLFHQMLEEHRGVFTWDEFREWAQHPAVEDRLWRPAQAVIEAAVASGADPKEAHEAMQWRIGVFYYSFLRELYVIARFREQDLPVLCHPLADALFRTDAWCDNVIVELYIPNPTFKTSDAGRKWKARELFADQPHFEVVELAMPTQHTFGNLHLPGPRTIDLAANKIRQALERSQARAETA